MMNYQKYSKGYFMPPEIDLDWAKKDAPDHAPIWCSVDLRDGNQALVVPMSLEEKLTFYKKLIAIGFKEIEIGFPAASETEYAFLRRLVEEDLIPDDVTVQVLTQAREHIIRKTFDALQGVKHAIVHVYNSTSVAQREQVFRKDKAGIKQLAVEGAQLLKELTEEAGADYRFEYSPESFTGTEPEYALEVCNAVLDVWQPAAERKAIINLPVTVEMSLPHVYAMQVAYMHKHLKYRDNIVLSLHPHNDRGCGVADTELGLLAGADRVEGTLFGNGERTGNVDLVTVAMNLFALGIDPQLDFSHMPELVSLYEQCTRMHVSPRQPYAGELVFAAFSGSHQDAIAKGMQWREEKHPDKWTLPYLYIDPKDVGRQYDGDVIRINSQSGKGGVGFILKEKYGIEMPKKMRESFGYCVKEVSDHTHQELLPEQVYEIFDREFLQARTPYALVDFDLQRGQDGHFHGTVTLQLDGVERQYATQGEGRLEAVSNVLQHELGVQFRDLTYTEYAMDKGRSQASRALACISITAPDGQVVWGAGIDPDIVTASLEALFSAVNRMQNGKH